ncbi:MAG: DUF3649 domain-containing protein, partial [Rhodospirillales bacterium]|nr:DUF3649 domain-containing protein [Rhodospirillales bacterium]
AIHAGTILWVFAARSATRAWIGVACAAAPPALLLCLAP